MLERIQKIIAAAGVVSRREAEKLILDGRVTVNGVEVTELGAKADARNDRICVDGKAVEVSRRRVYILLNKPAGYMTTLKDPQGRPVVGDLLKDVQERVFPVGRLDYNTEGLLLLTNDGEWANRLMHPRHEVEKAYLVRVRGEVSPQQTLKLIEGVELDGRMTAPARVELGNETGSATWFTITIHEGRFRQVRRMCDAVGLEVSRLKRIRYGEVELGSLKAGMYRELTVAEITALGGKVPPPEKAPAPPKGAHRDKSVQQREPARGGKPAARKIFAPPKGEQGGAWERRTHGTAGEAPSTKEVLRRKRSDEESPRPKRAHSFSAAKPAGRDSRSERGGIGAGAPKSPQAASAEKTRTWRPGESSRPAGAKHADRPGSSPKPAFRKGPDRPKGKPGKPGGRGR